MQFFDRVRAVVGSCHVAEAGLSPFPLEAVSYKRGRAQLGPIAPGPATVGAHVPATCWRLTLPVWTEAEAESAPPSPRRRRSRKGSGNRAATSERLRTQTRTTQTASRQAAKRQLLEVGGVWIDDGFDPKMTTVPVKAMSKAYFRILERQPSARKVFQLGNHVVWVTPSNTALLIDTSDGVEELSDADIDRLFTAPRKK